MNLVTCQKIIVATGILFNIGRRWGDEEPEEDGVDDDEADDVIIQDLSVATVRLRGQVERDPVEGCHAYALGSVWLLSSERHF
jgi:hypothetical protein